MVYDNAAGGTHFFQISGSPSVDIDFAGLVIRTGKKVQFYAGATIFENTGGNAFDTNIVSGYTYNFKINSVNKLQVHPTLGVYVADNLNMTTQKYINWSGGSFQQEDTTGLAYVYNVPTTFNHSFKINNTQVVKISTDVNGTLFTFPDGTIMREYTSFDWFLYQLPSGYTLKYQVGGTDIMEVSSAGAIIYESLSMRNGKRIVWDEGFSNIAHIRKDTTTSTFDYEVATGYTHKFMVNSVSKLLLDATNATFSGGIKMKAGQAIYPDDTLLGGAITSGGSGGIRFDADTGGSFRFINDSTLAITINGTLITIPANSNLQFGPTGSNISYAGTTTLRYNVPSGDTHMFRINASNILEVISNGISVVGGYMGRAGTGGALATTYNNAFYTGALLQAWNNATNLGNFTICDYRIKENIRPAGNVLERLCQVEMIEYNQKDISIFKNVGNQFGFIAHQVKDLFPELPNIVAGEKDGLNSEGDIQPQTINSEFTNLYLKAIQELNAKIEAQQAQIDSLLVAMAKLLSP
jgi:hypothetical protein